MDVICILSQTNIPIFKIKESSVRRRYRDFEWLKKELERDSKVSTVMNICTSKLIKSNLVICGIEFNNSTVNQYMSTCGSASWKFFWIAYGCHHVD